MKLQCKSQNRPVFIVHQQARFEITYYRDITLELGLCLVVKNVIWFTQWEPYFFKDKPHKFFSVGKLMDITLLEWKRWKSLKFSLACVLKSYMYVVFLNYKWFAQGSLKPNAGVHIIFCSLSVPFFLFFSFLLNLFIV